MLAVIERTATPHEKKVELPANNAARRCCAGTFRRRECWVPTARGWVALLTILIVVTASAVFQVHSFLAINHRVRDALLVVEGWSPDYVLEEAIVEFQRGPYRKLYVAGGPLEKGAVLSEYKTYAELGAANLIGLGFPHDAIEAAPAPFTWKDRTYVSAVALRKFLHQKGVLPANLNVMTLGPHSRRTQLMFQLGLRGEAVVGAIAVTPREYQPQRWWASSEGVRSVIGEFIAYSYAAIFFNPPAEQPALQ